MRLSSARELKAEMLGELDARFTTRRVEPIPHARAFSSRSAARRRGARRRARETMDRIVPAPVMAVGVAKKGNKPADYKLAVRVFAGKERAAAPMLKRLAPHAAECDIATGIRYRPRQTLRAGGSCGHFRITAGTLGAFVEDEDHYYLLSNNHVLANSDNGVRGDQIFQPGPADILTTHRVIGELERWIPLSPFRRDGVDAALARFDDSVRDFYPWSYTGIGEMRPEDFEDRFEVERVVKRGRTTRVTRGVVSAYELDSVAIDYADEGEPERVITYDDQLEIVGTPETRPFSQPGDSGSLILEQGSLRPYALLYGGGPDSQGIDRTLAHFVPDVMRHLRVRWVR